MSSPYPELKAKYTHLLDRTWELFKYGLAQERTLRAAVVTSHTQCERLMELNDIDEIKRGLRECHAHLTRVIDDPRSPK